MKQIKGRSKYRYKYRQNTNTDANTCKTTNTMCVWKCDRGMIETNRRQERADGPRQQLLIGAPHCNIHISYILLLYACLSVRSSLKITISYVVNVRCICVRCIEHGSHGLSIQRAQRMKSRGPNTFVAEKYHTA